MRIILCYRIYRFVLGCSFLLLYIPVNAQKNDFKIFLVGDAGEDASTGATLLNLKKQLDSNPFSAVIFLGDNSYKDDLGGIIPYGFKGFDSSRLTQEKVKSQLNILTNYKGYVFFVPGNHDWWNKTKEQVGMKKLKMEENFIERNLDTSLSIANPGNTFFPKNGEAGPAFIDLYDHSLRIIFVDTYRLIITAYKKKQEAEFPLEKEFYSKLDSLVQDAKKNHQQVIVAGHNTLYAKGPNTGPLKHPNLFGRIKASNTNFPSNKRMVDKMKKILEQYPGTYYVCGHIHSLQYYYPSDSIHYIISGAGSKTNLVSEKDIKKMSPANGNEYNLWNEKGFFEIDFSGSRQRIFMYYADGTQKCEIQ
jgi:UDP-2,3-diacylglucosamine pyrophosphatase LpxH